MSLLEELKARIQANKDKKDQEVEILPFPAYIKHYNFTDGIDKLATYLLYYSYIKFMKKHAPDYIPLKSTAFFRELKKYFKNVRWGNQRYYLINKSLLKNVTEELEFEAKLFKKRKKNDK